MRIRLVLIILLLFVFKTANGNEIGYAAFFYKETDNNESLELISDLSHCYEQLQGWFKDNNISNSIHSSKEFSITIDNKKISFDSKKLSLETGVIIIKSNGEFKEISPGTDVDIIASVIEYLNLHTLK